MHDIHVDIHVHTCPYVWKRGRIFAAEGGNSFAPQVLCNMECEQVFEKVQHAVRNEPSEGMGEVMVQFLENTTSSDVGSRQTLTICSGNQAISAFSPRRSCLSSGILLVALPSFTLIQEPLTDPLMT